MINISKLSEDALRIVARGLGHVLTDEDPVPQEALDAIEQFNAYQTIDAYVKALGFTGKTGDLIEALDHFRANEYSSAVGLPTP